MKKPAALFLPFIGLALAVGALLPGAQAANAEGILKKIDENRVSGNKVIISEMIIHGRRGSRTLRVKSWIQGTDKSFSEYLDPPREQGTKMLKLGDQLWTYYPASDRIILIAGHMLRQSVMGSDLSYEDMLEDPTLLGNHVATINGEETLLERPCWLMSLEAKKADAAYPQRRIWVDRERYTVLKEERFARSGKLLKITTVESVRRLGGRWVPDRARFKDALSEGEGTEFVIRDIEFDAAIPDSLFSKASLRK
ncbi:MAG: outer membrane lipoprotein-sorting protein [Candidatus Aminicenantes bacterium]|nr:outer membrane lipoprotein-sorting protein [Candidatus Aminicenantes bacterium]